VMEHPRVPVTKMSGTKPR